MLTGHIPLRHTALFSLQAAPLTEPRWEVDPQALVRCAGAGRLHVGEREDRGRRWRARNTTDGKLCENKTQAEEARRSRGTGVRRRRGGEGDGGGGGGCEGGMEYTMVGLETRCRPICQIDVHRRIGGQRQLHTPAAQRHPSWEGTRSNNVPRSQGRIQMSWGERRECTGHARKQNALVGSKRDTPAATHRAALPPGNHPLHSSSMPADSRDSITSPPQTETRSFFPGCFSLHPTSSLTNGFIGCKKPSTMVYGAGSSLKRPSSGHRHQHRLRQSIVYRVQLT